MSESIKHVVGFSGGIDSQACARWVLNRYPKEDVILLNSDVGGHEHPITTEFIEWYSENVHPVTVVTPVVGDFGTRCRSGEAGERRARYSDSDRMTFDVLAEIKGIWPSSRLQFCTEYLKLKPSHRQIKENLRDKGLEWVRYAGVRREESKRRESKQVIEWDDYFKCELIHPIVDWTKQMCFDYVKLHGEKVNPLYTLGFNRVGCAPCINSNKDDIREWATRYPEMIDKIRGWEKRTGMPFFKPRVPGGEPNWVDEVVDWSKTVRGGKQYSLLVLQEPAACDSDFGLCE